MCDLSKAPMGFEPTTFCLQDRRSNQLSYGALREIRVLLYLCSKMKIVIRIAMNIVTGTKLVASPLS